MSQLDPALLDTVKEALAVAGVEDTAVFVGGSQLVGLGNSRSNFNVYVVGDHGSGIPDRDLSSDYLDVERVEADRFQRDVDRVLAGAPDAGDVASFVAIKSGRELVVRFFYGGTVHYPHGVLGVLHTRLRAGETALSQKMIAWHAVQCVNYRDDYVGAVEATYLHTAEANANRLLNSALQTYLAGRGGLLRRRPMDLSQARADRVRARAGRGGPAPCDGPARQPCPARARAQGRARAGPACGRDCTRLDQTRGRGVDRDADLGVGAPVRCLVLRGLREPGADGRHRPVPGARVSPQGVELWASTMLGGREAAVTGFATGAASPLDEVEKYYEGFARRGMVREP